MGRVGLPGINGVGLSGGAGSGLTGIGKNGGRDTGGVTGGLCGDGGVGRTGDDGGGVGVSTVTEALTVVSPSPSPIGSTTIVPTCNPAVLPTNCKVCSLVCPASIETSIDVCPSTKIVKLLGIPSIRIRYLPARLSISCLTVILWDRLPPMKILPNQLPDDTKNLNLLRRKVFLTITVGLVARIGPAALPLLIWSWKFSVLSGLKSSFIDLVITPLPLTMVTEPEVTLSLKSAALHDPIVVQKRVSGLVVKFVTLTTKVTVLPSRTTIAALSGTIA